ncbi:DUF1194 domain-containing protein [Elioraea sp.]|uniref:DUF1194 domain-containing protein n=1 Tax=Elioraea sp. TaxID=2185103 RepID=UPI0025BF2587|nr:DUF1194 domain-containing protein [Elioraea sp.]
MTPRRSALLAAPALLIATHARAAEPVDVALVLAADASGSIDADEYRLQKEGIAEAVADARVLAGIRAGPLGRVALAYVEWGAPGGAATMVRWMIVSGAESAAAFGRSVMAAPRSVQSWNAIGDAIDHCAALILDAPLEPTRKVIDISGDAGDMRSNRPAPEARDAAVARGIQINALAIVEGRETLVLSYETTVIGGPGAFVETAPTRAEFTAALRRKLIREIA